MRRKPEWLRNEERLFANPRAVRIVYVATDAARRQARRILGRLRGLKGGGHVWGTSPKEGPCGKSE